MFIVFPLVAFAMTALTAGRIEGLSDSMFTTQMASIFIGMSLIMSSAGIIAEDRENKSLRFLVIAGVKPHSYLIGIGSVIFIASLITSIAFGFIGRFDQNEFLLFLVIMMSGAIASIMLGATIGMFSKNQQAATGISMPLAMVLGFGPMTAQFNEHAEKIFSVFYTQQINVVVNNFSSGISKPLIIVWSNIAVLAVLFALAYSKKGLRN
ncbi:MAG: ABC transporter permease [Treponema sp.]|nr:ABC transporter permease [Treponema sp.]